MKKNLLVMASGAILASMALVMVSCGKDDDNPTPSTSEISFEVEEAEVFEDEGTIEYKIVFDKPAPENFVLTIDVGGTAINYANVENPEEDAYDYRILDIEDEIEISEGDTEAKIKIQFASDFIVENAETIEIELDDVDSDLIEISNDDQLVITLVQEDGLAVRLDWGEDADPPYTDVDMDLFIWMKNDEGDFALTGLWSTRLSFASGELLFLPTKITPDNEFGVSANYYEGSEDPMDFVIKYIEIKNHIVQEAIERAGSYSQANINPWLVEGQNEPQNLKIEFTFEKSGTVFSNFSEFTLPEEHSRVRTLAPGRSAKRGTDEISNHASPF